MNEARLAGITPYTLRVASYYASMGVGTYRPKGYASFDRVEVSVLMPWQARETITDSALILSVEFYQADERVRYVEFALTPAGFGGKPIVRLVKNDVPDGKTGAED